MRSMRWTRRPSPAFVVALLALFLAVGGTSYAAGRAHFLKLGRTSKTSGATALVSKNKKHPALALKSTHKQPAASFATPKGVAPFTVNRTIKVTKLNADLLDGLDSSALQRTVSGTCASGSAIRAIAPAGTVTCETIPTPPAVPPAWRLGGNTGTSAANNFLGTTDNQPLVVKTNGKEAMRVSTAGNLGVGLTAPTARVDAVAGTGQTALSGRSTNGNAVIGSATSGAGVNASSTSGVGLNASSTSGVGLNATSGSGTAVTASSQNANSIVSQSGGGIGVLGISNARALVGTLGVISCPGTYAVGACGGTTGAGLVATSAAGDAVSASSTGGNAVSASSTAGIGVLGDSTSRGVVGTLGGTSCAGVYAVGACGSTVGDGLDANSVNNSAVSGTSTAGSGLVGTTAHPSGGTTAAGVIANNTGGGDIFIGEANGTHVARIDSTGKGFFDGGTQNSGADYAESVRAVHRAQLRRGDVLSVASGHGYAVTAARGRYSTRVMGVYSTRPAVLAVGNHRVGQSLAGDVPVAMMGVVPTKVTAAGGAIRPGDLLTTSRVPGYAMRARPVRIHGIAIYPTGTILGKALQPLRHGRGLIRVLLMSR